LKFPLTGSSFLRELLELFSEGSELLLQVGDLLAKRRDFFFEMRNGRGVEGWRICHWFVLRFFFKKFHITREEVGVARFLGARLSRKNLDQRRLALHQVLETGLDGAEIFERVHALGAGAEFPGGLRAAQKQDAEDGDFVAIEVESFLEAVFVLGDAAVRSADGADERLSVEGMQGLADGGLVESHDGFAVRFLVAGVEEGVEGEWIVFGRGDLFFDERTKDAAFDFGQLDVHRLKGYNG
jgi:hypothetical protein